jgi:omega-6 fatty acid desaturase (delta-12 desaturase)
VSREPSPRAWSALEWSRELARYASPDPRRSLRELLLDVSLYAGAWALMLASYERAYGFTLLLAVPCAGLVLRIFSIQHDCGHGAFFRSRRLNDALGAACSLLTLAPYLSWRRQHAGHHGVWNNLDRRNSGADIYSTCLTADEYRSLGPWRRRWYRLSRSPVVANLVLPPLVFLVLYRFPFDMPAGWRRERIAIQLTNLALVALFGGLGLVFGFGQVAAIHLPVMVLASIVGVWLFSVQHRSEEAAWARHDEWNAVTASLQGSTYLRLPRILQWFTGNIGLHHVHHLNPRIPNYRLQQCHEAVAELRRVPVVTLRSAFRSMLYVLWDERGQRMVTFRAAELA